MEAGNTFTLTCRTSISEQWEKIGGTLIDLHHFFSFVEHEGNSGLPPPLRPNARQHSPEEALGRGSLSDFSDYESSDEETHNENATSSSNNQGRRAYPGASDFDLAPKKGLLDDDPFADPFGDGHGVDDSSSTRENGKQRQW